MLYEGLFASKCYETVGYLFASANLGWRKNRLSFMKDLQALVYVDETVGYPYEGPFMLPSANLGRNTL